MAYISEEEAEMFEKFAKRGRRLKEKLNHLLSKKSLTEREKIIADEIKHSLNEIDEWFRRTAKYD